MANYNEISFTGTDGLRLFARDYAPHPGPARLPVICIHGLTRNSGDFEDLAPHLMAMHRRVIAVDVRGRGRSARDPDPDNYSAGVYAADVQQLMSHLGIAQAAFIGTSMGGLITMTLAARRLDLVACAVLNDIGPIISEKGLVRIARYTGQAGSFASWGEAAAYVKDINQCAFPANPDSEWERWARRAFEPGSDGRLVPRYDPNIAVALRTGKLQATSPEAQAAFRQLAANRPVLLLRGALSDLLEPEQAEWMREAAPAMQYAEVPGVGHAPMLTEPQALEAIRQFLSQVP